MTKQFGKDLVAAGKKVALVGGAAFAAFSAVAIKAASDAAETTSKFKTVFGTATDEMNRFVRDLQKTVPATRKELQDMSSSLQDLLVPMGVIPSEALKMNKQFVTLAADLASFNNIPIADALNKLRAGLVGSSEPLLALGVDTRAAAIEVKALELGLIKEGQEVSNAARAQAVLAIAMEQSTFAIGDAGRTVDSTANQMKFLKRDIEELTQVAGEAMIPAFSAVLGMLVEVTSEAQNTGDSMVGLAEIAAFPVKAFFRIEEVAARIIKQFLGMRLTILRLEASYQRFGRFIGVNTTAKLEDLNLSIMQVEEQMQEAENAADAWVSKQADLIDSLNQLKRPLKDAVTDTKKLGDETKGAGDSIANHLTPKVKAATDQVIDMSTAMANAIAMSQNLAIAGSNLGSAQDNMIRSLKDANEITLKSVGLNAQNTDALIKQSQAWDVARDAAEKMGGGVAAVEADLDALGEAQKRNASDTKEWSSVWAKQVSTIVTDFSKGVADMIFEGKNLKDTMIGIFKEMGKAIVRSLIEDLIDKGLGALTDFVSGIGGIFKGGIGGGSGGGVPTGGGGGIPTASFTELAITGVAIQTGIFGTGVGITGVTIQKGEFHTGVSFTGFSLKFGGGGDTKETALNTRILKDASIDFFLKSINIWETFRDNNVRQLGGIQAWTELGALELVNVRNQMDTLISIQRDRIAPAVESIDSKTPTEITFSPVINVSVSGGVADQSSQKSVGTQIADQAIKVIMQGVKTNKLGLRTVLQNI